MLIDKFAALTFARQVGGTRARLSISREDDEKKKQTAEPLSEDPSRESHVIPVARAFQSRDADVIKLPRNNVRSLEASACYLAFQLAQHPQPARPMADDLYARSSALPRRFIKLMSTLRAGGALALVFSPLERIRAAYERAREYIVDISMPRAFFDLDSVAFQRNARNNISSTTLEQCSYVLCAR